MRQSLGTAAAVVALPALFLALGAGAASARPASGDPPPPKGFEADSVSFISAHTGFVLGARRCSRMPCKALLDKTVNGGRTWSAVPAPAVPLVPPFNGPPQSGVSTVRFENARDGWLFNPGLWATTNGGRRWHRVPLPGEVVAVAAAGGQVFAAAEPVNGGLGAARLYRSKAGSTRWSRVAGVAPSDALTVSGHSVWAGVAPRLWRSADSGAHWSRLPFHCPADLPDASPVAAASATHVALACVNPGFPQPGSSVKRIFTSADGGRTFHLAGRPAEPGEVGLLAMPPRHPRVITFTAASGASYLYRSADGGKTWHIATYLDAGLGFRDLAYASATTGYLVHSSGGPVIAYGRGLMKTTNAGATWEKLPIP